MVSLGLVFVWFYGFSLGGSGFLSCAPLSHYFDGSFFFNIFILLKKRKKTLNDYYRVIIFSFIVRLTYLGGRPRYGNLCIVRKKHF